MGQELALHPVTGTHVLGNPAPWWRRIAHRLALLHRLGMEHRKPQAVSQKLDVAKQAASIKAYNTLLNGLSDDEAVMFADAVRPVSCWAPKDTKVAVDQTSASAHEHSRGH